MMIEQLIINGQVFPVPQMPTEEANRYEMNEEMDGSTLILTSRIGKKNSLSWYEEDDEEDYEEEIDEPSMITEVRINGQVFPVPPMPTQEANAEIVNSIIQLQGANRHEMHEEKHGSTLVLSSRIGKKNA